ncbi:CDP-diacylglycerol--glycerol-3-phosphate 3-phosphatidyltransferase [Neptunomonas marina]|uniref:CDP-diacylglycerol--glycerol-3-phosphate 3-phosphatidyltransferase n=2 Tax=Neptunomonas marina TaxID=1815562 RepID=A0A437Q4S0_9GAMM|nr:CDP-diacylglycerol--glycerol-3-phosphate 3-phosphatidyltransferase [Neptunomonas marina]
MLTRIKIPNLLTLLRIILIPVFVVIYYLPWECAGLAAGAVFAFAAVTDWFDGYLARKLDQASALGAFLDPVADKLIVVAALVMLVETFNEAWITLPVMVIISREVLISALREWMAELGKRASVAVSFVGKVKTALQMLAIFLMITFTPFSELSWAGIGALYIAAALTLWSMIVYLKAAWPDLTEDL